MINLNLPDFVDGRAIYDHITQLAREHPEAFYEDTTIASIFGCFPGCIWNGGGTNFHHPWMKEDMAALIKWYNDDLQIPLRFTFTNPVLQEKHVYDTYGNLIAELGHNGKNEILTSSRILENYLRKNYPNYKYCSSIVGTDVEPYSTDPRYGLVVMRRRMNNNWDYLDQVPYEDRHRIEFLCNDPCPDDCPRIYSHYRDLGRAQLEFNPDAPNTQCSMKHIRGDFEQLHLRSLETHISREKIEKEYLPRGYNQFKVSGRGNPEVMALNIIRYMVKPDYRDDIFCLLLAPHIRRLDDELLPCRNK